MAKVELRETVWKIAEGFSRVRFWGKRLPTESSCPPLGGLRSPDSALISIFQTVSEGVFSEVRAGLRLVAS